MKRREETGRVGRYTGRAEGRKDREWKREKNSKEVVRNSDGIKERQWKRWRISDKKMQT